MKTKSLINLFDFFFYVIPTTRNELITLTKDEPTFKFMFDVQLDVRHATFSGHLAIENSQGREFILGMPPHALTIQE